MSPFRLLAQTIAQAPSGSEIVASRNPPITQ
jgi:hypothetical protein